MKSLPQEIEIWYLIPALRRELAKIFISDYGMTQKQVSQLLYLTESAVSQYITLKRGKELEFSNQEIEEIKKTAVEILSNKTSNKTEVNENLYKLSVKFRGCNSLCNFHKKQDSSISKDCDLCLA